MKETREKKERECLRRHRHNIEPVIVSDGCGRRPLPFDHGEEQNYQSEAALEDDLHQTTVRSSLQYADIHDGLKRTCASAQKLNDYRFSDEEWKRFCGSHSIVEAPSPPTGTRHCQSPPHVGKIHCRFSPATTALPRTSALIDKTNIHRNVQVIHRSTRSMHRPTLESL